MFFHKDSSCVEDGLKIHGLVDWPEPEPSNHIIMQMNLSESCVMDRRIFSVDIRIRAQSIEHRCDVEMGRKHDRSHRMLRLLELYAHNNGFRAY